MQKLIKATVLTLVLAIPALAGNIGCPAPPPPGGRQTPATSEPAKTGDMGCQLAASEITMTLLRSLLVLF